MSKLIRLGLVGAGRWGRNYIRAISGKSDVVLAAVASRNVETPTIVGSECQVVHGWRELIEVVDLDGVIVATPPATHAEIVGSAIDKGLAILVEKPLTLNADEANALVSKARQGSAIVLVDHIHLFSPAYRALRRELPRLGPIHRIEGIAGNFGPFRDDTPVLWDWGSHDVAMCLDLMEEMPSGARAKIINREIVNEHCGETIEINLQFSNGAEASILIGNIMREKTRRFTVRCRSGSIVYDDCALAKAALVDSSGNRWPVDYEDETPLSRVIRDFTEAIREQRPQFAGLILGGQVTEILSSTERSIAGSREMG